MAASHTLPQSPALQQISKSGVLVLHGFGIKVRLENSHFLAEWGVGLERYQVRLSRVEGHKLRRVVLLSSDGYISLEALRFISDVGASFSFLDKRGKAFMVCSPVSPSDSKLRRAQSLALTNGTALRISKEISSEKLASQTALVRDMLHDPSAADAIARIRTALSSAESIEAVRFIEARGSKIYWSAWTGMPLRWVRKDERRVPESWKIFYSRISPLTHSPRLACDPMNACMNLLHALTEIESRIVLVACGLDAEIGLLHADTPNRSSLANDLQEMVRTKVDAFVLDWFQREPLRKADFWEDRSGCCRLSTELAGKLCQTSDTWYRLLAPHAEWLSLKLYESTIPARSHFSRNVLRLATRLTQRHRREIKGSEVPVVNLPATDHLCEVCGAKIRRRNSKRCAKCSKQVTSVNFTAGRRAAQNPEHRAKMANTMRAHRRAIANWNRADLPAWLDSDTYRTKVLPALASVIPTQITRALSCSWPYAKAIQVGRYIPHMRHWPALAKLAGISR